MKRCFLSLASLAIACHAPTSAAQYRAIAEGDPPTYAAGTLDTSTPPAAPLIAVTRGGGARRREDPLEPARTVTICCDDPSGLCFADSGERCQSVTSTLQSCPVAAVRGVGDGFVVCAD